MKAGWAPVVLFAILLAGHRHVHAQAMPAAVRGSWKISRILPVQSAACWDAIRAKSLLGTTLTYGAHTLDWQGGREPISEALTRSLSSKQFQDEPGAQGKVRNPDLKQLGIAAARVVEIDLQHEDADVTGATTEVPGDTILLAGPGRIVVSACGVYYAAVRVDKPLPRPPASGPGSR